MSIKNPARDELQPFCVAHTGIPALSATIAPDTMIELRFSRRVSLQLSESLKAFRYGGEEGDFCS